MPLTPAQRSMHARLAAYAMHAKHGANGTAAARRGLERKWEREVDPEGVLPPEELAKRVALKRKQHMTALALKASRLRSMKAPASAKSTAIPPAVDLGVAESTGGTPTSDDARGSAIDASAASTDEGPRGSHPQGPSNAAA